ncbi:hypothetical protein TNCV_4025931 [Trichonephila clavipes]|nr:hypothetical protein TNCV_4025931 [Trichonephila clavipes]
MAPSTYVDSVPIVRRWIREWYEQMSPLDRRRAIELKEAICSNHKIARHLGHINATIRQCLQEWVNNDRVEHQEGSG